MHHRVAALIAKKDNPVQKNKKQKIQYENYKIAKGISLKIINAKVEKAKVDIYGNFIYKVDNESHYEVGVEMDFSNSKDLKIKDYHNDEEEEEKRLIIQELIEPFSSVIKKISQEDEARKQLLIANKYNKMSNKLLTSTEIDDKVDVNVGKICEIEYMIGFKIDAKIKFQINFPILQKQHRLIKPDVDSISDTLIAIETIFKNVSFERISNEKLQDLFLNNNIYFFVDLTFPPTQPSEITIEIPKDKNVTYPENERTLAIHWRKINTLLPSGKGEIYNEDDISPIDVIYGYKRNTKIMCILSHLAENSMFIQKILPSNEINSIGIYYVKFFVDGSWESVVIDGFIPCFLYSHPIYTYSQNSGWVMLVEKALAKFFNGYENLSKLEVEDTYRLLTGFPVNHIKYDEDATVTTQQSMNLQDSTGKLNFSSSNPVSNQEKLIDEFFSKLETISNEGYLMCAFSDYPPNKQNKKYDTYFMQGFYYPIVAAVKLSYFKMIVVRNIWTDMEFQGEFYMNAAKLPQKMLRYLEKYQDKTLMTMTPAEFVKFFNNVVIIQSKNYYELSLRSSFIRCQDSIEVELENLLSYFHYEITVNELTDVKIRLSTINDSYFDEKYHSEKMDMSIGILTKDEFKNWQKFYYKEFEFEKDIIAEVQLPPGKYYLIPLTMGYCMRKNKNCYTTNPNFFLQDGTLNYDVIDRVTQHLFYLYDPYCKGIIEKKDIINIYERLNLQFDEEEDYEKIISKYCKHSVGITVKGLKNLMRDIFSFGRGNHIDYLRNLGYDKHLYPYLHRFYFITFYSSNEVIIRPKINIGQNLEKTLNNLFLQEIESDKKVKGTELNLVSYKSTSGYYYIEGVKNCSRRERKEVIFDASQSVNLFSSTNVLKYSKFIDINTVEFLMYLVIDNLIEPYVKSKPKQGEAKEREYENAQASPNIMRSTISASNINTVKDKFEHKKIVNLDSIPLMKNYII